LLTNEKLRSIVAGSERYRKPPSSELTVHNFEEGVEIWDNEDVKNFFFNKSMKWRPKNEIAVFLPCSACKPYPYSDSHRDGYLKALLPYLDRIDLFVVSEPMGIVPYFYSDEYPVDSYEYNPYKFFIGKQDNPLVEKALQIFISRLALWIKKFHELYELRILALPKSWHLKVFKRSLSEVKIAIDQYKIVSLSGRARNSLSELKIQFEFCFQEGY
jgi:hypothetical protein